MKAEELRINNWYMSTKFQTPVICEMGDFYEIFTRADGACEYDIDDIFQPIPLTEEWLLKFGFEIFPWGWVKKSNSDFGIRLNLRSFSYDLEGNNPVQLKYVHQLQNLYFALTGEELTIK